MIVNSKNTGKCRFGYNGLVYEAKFQRALDEERQRQMSNPIFSLMDTNTRVGFQGVNFMKKRTAMSP